MDALVLSGGNIKGAYQAGIVSTMLRAGFRPGIITGISVGALNAGFLAASAPAGRVPDWPAVGRALEDFWRREVTSPKRFLKTRGKASLVLDVLRKRWRGLVDTSPLHAVVRRTFAELDPRGTGVVLRIGAVDLVSGAIEYRGREGPGAEADADLVEFILASTAEPIGMPLHPIGRRLYYDGGLRDITPLAQALDAGATTVVCAVTQPEAVGPLADDFAPGNLFELITRVTAVLKNEIVENDIETFVRTNRRVRANPADPALAGKRDVPILVVRPSADIPLSLTAFTSEDIHRMILQGGMDAATAIGRAQGDPEHPGHRVARTLRLEPA